MQTQPSSDQPLDETQPVVEVPNRFAALSDNDVAENLVNVRAWLEQRTKEFYASIAQNKEDEKLLHAEAVRRIVKNNAKQLIHPTHTVELKLTKTKEKRIDVLRGLEKIVPADELKKGLYLTQPKPEWVANMTHLKPLVAKYGAEVAKIIRDATPETITKMEIVITERETNTRTLQPDDQARLTENAE